MDFDSCAQLAREVPLRSVSEWTSRFTRHGGGVYLHRAYCHCLSCFRRRRVSGPPRGSRFCFIDTCIALSPNVAFIRWFDCCGSTGYPYVDVPVSCASPHSTRSASTGRNAGIFLLAGGIYVLAIIGAWPKFTGGIVGVFFLGARYQH